MAKNQPFTLELFGKALDRLIEMVLLGKAHVRIGRGLGQALQGDPAIAHVAPVFWGMSLNAHLDIGQLVAFKLFDTHHGTITVEFLLAKAEELKDSLPNAPTSQVEETIKTANIQISSLADPLKRIRAKRNRVLAHVDLTIVRDPEKLAKQVELTFSDLNMVLGTAGIVLNDLSVGFRDTSPLYEMIGSDDYDGAINLIADAKCAQIRDFEAKFGHWDGLRPMKCQ